MRNRLIGALNPWQKRPVGEIIVAHFDHGIRDDSADDELFVRNLAKEYGCEYRTCRKELGANTSEETARHYRYEFLREICQEFDAQLITAHHMNDIAETIAINVTRGTGWRGVSVMDTTTIWRPLLSLMKREILEYAEQHGIQWHEDSTNTSTMYLRNKIRRQLQDEQLMRELAALRAAQVELKHAIDDEVEKFLMQDNYSRYFFAHCGDTVAIEVLRALFIQKKGRRITIPARIRALHSIKVAHHGTVAQVGEGVTLRFTRTHFIVE